MNETQISALELLAEDRVILGKRILKVVDTVYDSDENTLEVFFNDDTAKVFSKNDSVFVLDYAGEGMEKFTHKNRDNYES